MRRLPDHCDCCYRLDEVIHLECDPGQSEFSPPGCLTLHTVRQTLQGNQSCVLVNMGQISAQRHHFTNLYNAISLLS